MCCLYTLCLCALLMRCFFVFFLSALCIRSFYALFLWALCVRFFLCPHCICAFYALFLHSFYALCVFALLMWSFYVLFLRALCINSFYVLLELFASRSGCCIAIISSVRQVITNEQRLTEWSLLYISNKFLNNLEFPNNAVLCITPTWYIIPSFSIHISVFLWHLQGLLSLWAQLLPFWFLIIFQSFSSGPDTFPLSCFFSYSYISWYSNIDNNPLSLFFVTYKMSGFLVSITLPHWTLIFHNTFNISISTAPSGMCSYHFSMCSNSFFWQRSKWIFFATLSCRLWYSFYYPLNKCCTLSPFFLNNMHRGLLLVLLMWCFI